MNKPSPALIAIVVAILAALFVGSFLGGMEPIDCNEAPNPDYCELVTQ